MLTIYRLRHCEPLGLARDKLREAIYACRGHPARVFLYRDTAILAVHKHGLEARATKRLASQQHQNAIISLYYIGSEF